MMAAFLVVGSVVLLEAVLIRWLITHLQKVERLPWW